jgi:hypothetical protein
MHSICQFHHEITNSFLIKRRISIVFEFRTHGSFEIHSFISIYRGIQGIFINIMKKGFISEILALPREILMKTLRFGLQNWQNHAFA